MDWSKLDGVAILTIIAIIIGPIAAIQIQKFLEWRQEKFRSKMNIFRTLMATRTTRLSTEHVQALNGIELVFYRRNPFWGTKDKAVLAAWSAYHDHLKNKPVGGDPARLALWDNTVVDLFIDLLQKMATSLRYDFDSTYIRNSWYAPEAHTNIEQENNLIKTALKELLTGNRWLRVAAVDPKVAQEAVERALGKPTTIAEPPQKELK